jgi:hypothetical protein
MTEPHKRANRPPKYTTAYRVHNGPKYDQALRDRGDITLWISQAAIDAWTAPKTGRRGAQPVYADSAIETARTLRWLFRLPLRQTEGLLHSIVKLMRLTLSCPDHTTRSRRHATTVTESHEQDPAQVPTLLAQVHQPIDRCIADGIYDQQPVYAAVAHHSPGARVIIPPRKDTVLRPMAATAPSQRDPHLSEIESAGRCPWKRTSGYYAQSHAEHAFSRDKRTFRGGLRAKREEAQEREASIACGLLNRMRELGRPQSYPVR